MGLRLKGVLVLSACSLLAACGGSNVYDDGPDEFSILTYKQLRTPPANAALPSPTPGGANLADPTPYGDAVAALGGQRSLATPPPGYYSDPDVTEGKQRRGFFGWLAGLFGG